MLPNGRSSYAHCLVGEEIAPPSRVICCACGGCACPVAAGWLYLGQGAAPVSGRLRFLHIAQGAGQKPWKFLTCRKVVVG